MTTPWLPLRTDVVIADLATTDTDMEALQAAHADVEFASPNMRIPDSGDSVTEFGFIVIAYDDAGVVKPGTVTAQVVERSPKKNDNETMRYAGAAPEVGLPTGRMFTVPGRYFHEFTVRLSNVVAADATKLLVEYRALR